MILKRWLYKRQMFKVLKDIDKQIESDPTCLVKPDPEMLAEIDKLVEGVNIDECD